jgi:hypothetical protein
MRNLAQFTMSGVQRVSGLRAASYSVQRFGAPVHYTTRQARESVGSISGSTRSCLQDSWTSAFYARAPGSGKWRPSEDKKRGLP